MTNNQHKEPFMKFNIFLTSLLFSALAHGKVITQNHPITEPAFSQLIYQAYGSEELLNPDGSFTFPRGFACKLDAGVPACELLANEWNMDEGLSATRGRMFAPTSEDAIFDLMEYMKQQPLVKDEGNGVISRTKTLEVTVLDKLYSLICTEATHKKTNEQFSNCVLFNGVRALSN